MQKNTLKESLRKLKNVVEWFDNQEEVDLAAALAKVKEGAALIQESRRELRTLENEFEKIKKDLDFEGEAVNEQINEGI